MTTPMTGKQCLLRQDFLKRCGEKCGGINAPMFLPNLSPSCLMQTAGTSPAHCYSSSAPDTILGSCLHTNEPFQKSFSDVFGTNRLFSDMLVQHHLLLIARVYLYSALRKPASPFLQECLQRLRLPARVSCARLWGPCWEECMHLKHHSQPACRLP